MIDDTPRRKLIKTNQGNENDHSDETVVVQRETISTFNDDDLARKVEECFRDTESNTDAEMMDTEEMNQKSKSATRPRRSRFRFSFSNNHSSQANEEDEEKEERKSRLSRTHSASIIHPENTHSIHSSSRRRKSYSTTGLANELKNLPNEPTINTDKVYSNRRIELDFLFVV